MTMDDNGVGSMGRPVPSPMGVGSGEGAVPNPGKFLEFFIGNGAFWCISRVYYRIVRHFISK